MSNRNSRRKCNTSECKSYDGLILSFQISKPSKGKITALFMDDNGNKVKDDVNVYQKWDVKECPVLLYQQVINLGDLYDYWESSIRKPGLIVLGALS
jgi:hypothetical protein